jgi:glucosamine kinase
MKRNTNNFIFTIMILIADSGSTKTDWRLVNKDGKINSFSTIGLNPYHITSEIVLNALASSDMAAIKNTINKVVFYGAGCSSPEKKAILEKPLATFFANAEIEVEHDLLAAARATCGNEKGMVAILGTGSNSCLYDGDLIVQNVTALGYILGDYGSGVHIGKTFLQALLANELPSEITLAFKQQYNLHVTDILDAVYKQPLPNRFLASFSEFVFQHLDCIEMKDIVTQCFHSFFKTNICKYTDYQNLPLHLIGSIAFIYQDILTEVAKKYNVTIGNIIKQPIEELVKYHS